MEKQRGFTLLELLMVVIIIGILASMALPQFLKSTERARSGQVISLLSSLRASEARYYAQNSSVYTTTLANLDITMPATMPVGWDTPAVTLVPNLAKVNRNSGDASVSGKQLQINLDTGVLCASDAGSATTWGVSATC